MRIHCRLPLISSFPRRLYFWCRSHFYPSFPQTWPRIGHQFLYSWLNTPEINQYQPWSRFPCPAIQAYYIFHRNSIGSHLSAISSGTGCKNCCWGSKTVSTQCHWSGASASDFRLGCNTCTDSMWSSTLCILCRFHPESWECVLRNTIGCRRCILNTFWFPIRKSYRFLSSYKYAFCGSSDGILGMCP